VTRYLLDTTPLTAYLRGITAARTLIEPWITRREVVTSILVYGEVTEYNRSFADMERRQRELQQLLQEVTPYIPTYIILERYADMRRQMRPPHGSGLIGDIDTLIAATALVHDLTLVTTDTDFQRVPGLASIVLPRRM
jgi:predicted nucleic acid-binding protein